MKLINMRGLRVKIVMVLLCSLIISIVFGVIFSRVFTRSDDTFKNEIKYFANQCKDKEAEILNCKNDEDITSVINNNIKFADIFILNSDGEVLIKNDNSMEKTFDLDSLMKAENNMNTTAYAIKYNFIDKIDNSRYILFSGIVKRGDLNMIIPIIIFIGLFFLLTDGKLKYIKELCNGLKEISEGNLMYKVRENGKDEISEIGKNINKMTQRLHEYREKEKEAEKNKDLFIMNISHDLRTPLTSIIGYVNLLKDKCGESYEIRKYIDIIDSKSARLDKLINDFFDYNKLKNCEIELNRIDISLNEFLRQIITGIMPLGSKKNLNINLILPEENISVNIDPDMMLRVMENLLMNAIRYCNNDSEIQVSLNREEKSIICITNQCNEFDKREISNIFDRFYRGDKARNTIEGGAGLGLAIAKNIIELHEGQIFAEYDERRIYIKVAI